MLRPATPLTILLGAAFALMLLAVLSVPIIEMIPLGRHQGTSFGVFGTCNSNGCSGIQVGYDASKATGNQASSFDLPSGVRNTLSAVLIVHPVAALLTLVLFILAGVAHVHSAAHSTRYLLIVFIFLLIDFLVCLCAFIIDVLLFIPHMAWGSYIVLASTILVALSGLVTCAMRRTLIGRKDRQKRIDQNAEMSGENYYNREAAKPTPTEFVVRQPTVPSVSGANGTQDQPSFGSFEPKPNPDHVSDDNVPLTHRTTSNRSPISAHNEPAAFGEVGGFNGPQRSGSRDQYGNPINEPQDAYGVRRGPSTETMRRGRGDMGPPGGYGGRGGGYGRGGYDNYGGSMRGRRSPYGPRGGARGGYVPPYQQRGAYGPNMGVRGGRSPPPGYGPGQLSRRPTDPSQGYPGTQPAYGNYNAAPPPSESMVLPPSDFSQAGIARAESPPPLPGSEPATIGGQPIEMDAMQSRPAPAQYGALRDSDADVAGMVGLQQGQMGHAPPNRHDTYMSEASKYSTDEYGAPLQPQQKPSEYVPPRAAWAQGNGRSSPRVASPLSAPGRQNSGGGEYYEDIDPRFASNTPPGASANSLVPPPIEPIYEDPRDNNPGSRSPAESEKSTFTSISQRGVNPRWNPSPVPPMPYQQQGGPMARRPVQQRQDMLLDNPDFQMPNARGPKGPGVIPGSAYPGGRM